MIGNSAWKHSLESIPNVGEGILGIIENQPPRSQIMITKPGHHLHLLATMTASVVFCLISHGADSVSPDDAFEGMPQDDARHIQNRLPGIVVGPAKNVPPLKNAEDWWPLKEATLTYGHGNDHAESETVVVKKIARAPGSTLKDPIDGWALELPGGTTRYLTTNDPYGIVSPSALNKSYSVIIELDPAEPIVHSGSKPGTSASRKTKVDVYNVGDLKSTAYTGTVDCTWTDLGGWRVKVPMGEYDTRLVKVEYNGSVGPASVTGSNYVFLAKGEGVVAYSDGRDISAFIIFNLDNETGGVLKSVQGRKPSRQPEQKKPNTALKKP